MNLYVVLVGASFQPQAEALYGETGTRKLRGEEEASRRRGGAGFKGLLNPKGQTSWEVKGRPAVTG